MTLYSCCRSYCIHFDSEEPVDSEVASPTPAPAKPKGQYVPSFIPPSMAAAMEADEQAKRAQVVEEVEVDEVGTTCNTS